MGPAKSVFLHWAISLTVLHVCSAGNRAHSLKHVRQFEFFCWCAGGLISQDRVSLYPMLSWNLHYRADWLQTPTSSSWVQGWRPEQPHTWLGVSFLHWVATSMSVCLFVCLEFDFYCGSRHGMEHISFRQSVWFSWFLRQGIIYNLGNLGSHYVFRLATNS